jgi:hypothetical protein
MSGEEAVRAHAKRMRRCVSLLLPSLAAVEREFCDSKVAVTPEMAAIAMQCATLRLMLTSTESQYGERPRFNRASVP